MVYYWLETVTLALERVKARVAAGGHCIPEEVISRRYYTGLKNFLNLYKNKADYRLLVDDSTTEQETIAEGYGKGQYHVENTQTWTIIKTLTSNDQ